MDVQQFEWAVCLASFGQLWSGSPRQVTEFSNIAGRLQASVSSRKLLWCDFSLDQCCRSTDLWLLRPYGAHNLHSELRYSWSHWMTKYLAIKPSDDNTCCAIMSTRSSLLAFFFSHRKPLFRFNGTSWIFFNHPVLSINRFSCQLIFNKLLYTESAWEETIACAHQAFARFVLRESDGGDMKKWKG